jgi:hypothetical protein
LQAQWPMSRAAAADEKGARRLTNVHGRRRTGCGRRRVSPRPRLALAKGRARAAARRHAVPRTARGMTADAESRAPRVKGGESAQFTKWRGYFS